MSWRPRGAPTWQKITSRWMKSACFSLLVFREQWKCWIVYRGLIKCGQWGHVPTANCWPPPPAGPQPALAQATRSQLPAPILWALPHASSYRLFWLHICVWHVLILTFHSCPALRGLCEVKHCCQAQQAAGLAICRTLCQEQPDMNRFSLKQCSVPHWNTYLFLSLRSTPKSHAFVFTRL